MLAVVTFLSAVLTYGFTLPAIMMLTGCELLFHGPVI
jgi:hypothetical protein